MVLLIPLSRSSYRRGDLPEATLVNGYFEADPLNQEDQVSILRRFGLVSLATCGSGPIRGVYAQSGSISGLAIVVSGTSVYKVTTGGTATQISGTIAGTGRVRMAGSGAKVIISNDATLYETDGSTLSAVTLPDTFTPGDVGYINGRFVVGKLNTHRYYWSGVASTTFDALDYASAEMAPDALEGFGIATDEVWFFGASSVEVAQPTADPDAPFVRVQGRAYDMGCASKHTIVKIGGGIVWVGADDKIYSTAGGVAEISNSAMVERVRDSAAANLRAWRVVVDGHEFYVLTTTSGTFAYDITTRLWTQFESVGLTTLRAHVGTQFGTGSFIAGDSENGTIWTVSETVRTDDGGVISMEVGGMLTVKTPTRCDRVRLDVTVGSADTLAEDPMVAMCWSDDDGGTYSDWHLAPLGRQGNRLTRVEWRRLGMMGIRHSRRRIFKFRITDPVSLSIRTAEVI